MAQRSIKMLLLDSLEDLSEKNFQKFIFALVNRRGEPRVSRSWVEGKRHMDVVDVLTSTFTENGSVTVAVELLKDINCNLEAEKLAEAVKKAGFPYQDAASGEAKETKQESLLSPDAASCEEEHFVDQHMDELVQRVTSIAPILDKLLKAKIIQEETYDKISALPTSQEQMRALYRGPLKGGKRCKDVFYEILKKLEPFLIQDLLGK